MAKSLAQILFSYSAASKPQLLKQLSPKPTSFPSLLSSSHYPSCKHLCPCNSSEVVPWSLCEGSKWHIHPRADVSLFFSFWLQVSIVLVISPGEKKPGQAHWETIKQLGILRSKKCSGAQGLPPPKDFASCGRPSPLLLGISLPWVFPFVSKHARISLK